METCGSEIIERLRESTRSTAYRARRRADGLPLDFKALKNQHPSQAQIASLRHEHAVLSDRKDVDGLVRRQHPLASPRLDRVALSALTAAPMDDISTLYVSPITRAAVAPEVLERIGWDGGAGAGVNSTLVH